MLQPLGCFTVSSGPFRTPRPWTRGWNRRLWSWRSDATAGTMWIENRHGQRGTLGAQQPTNNNQPTTANQQDWVRLGLDVVMVMSYGYDFGFLLETSSRGYLGDLSLGWSLLEHGCWLASTWQVFWWCSEQHFSDLHSAWEVILNMNRCQPDPLACERKRVRRLRGVKHLWSCVLFLMDLGRIWGPWRKGIPSIFALSYHVDWKMGRDTSTPHWISPHHCWFI